MVRRKSTLSSASWHNMLKLGASTVARVIMLNRLPLRAKPRLSVVKNRTITGPRTFISLADLLTTMPLQII